ncbi:MAG: glycosyltransferase, partial [Pseudomonadota bacterium]
RAVFDALPTTNKSFHGFLPYEAYLDLMATCAVSLSPVEGRLYEDTKSDAKFLDAAARGVVTLASPTIYAETIVHGQTGLIAQRLKDWAPQLAGALRDEPARQVMARQAWDYVRDNRMFAHQAADRSAWYRELWDRREELNAGLLTRLPGLAQALA